MKATYIKATSSPYEASRSSILGTFTLWVILVTSFVSISRNVRLIKLSRPSRRRLPPPEHRAATPSQRHKLFTTLTPAAAVEDGKKLSKGSNSARAKNVSFSNTTWFRKVYKRNSSRASLTECCLGTLLQAKRVRPARGLGLGMGAEGSRSTEQSQSKDSRLLLG